MTTTVTLTPATPAGRTMLIDFALLALTGPEPLDGYLNRQDAAEADPEAAEWLTGYYDRELERTLTQ